MIQLIMTIAIILPLCITFQLRSHTLHRVLSSRDISTLLGVQDQGSRMVREGPSVMPSAMRFQMRNEVGNKYRELMGENIDELLQLLQQFIDASNYSGFVQDVKTLASSAPPDNPPEMIDSLYQMIKTILDRLKGEQLADIIWSLGKFANRVSNVKFRAVHQRLWSRLCAQINLTSRQVTTSFGGLAKLGILWQGMPPADRTSLERIVVSVAGSLNEREVGNLLHSLSRMGVQWAELSAHVQEALLANLLRQHKSMRAEHGTMTVYALGILGLSVEQLSPAERTGIFSMSTALLQDVLTKPPLRNRCQQAANVIYGLAKMGAQFCNCPAALQESILSTLAVPLQFMNAQEVSNTVYSLCILGVKWRELPGEVHATLQSAIAAQAAGLITQGLSITLYGLGTMEAPWSTLAPAVVDALQAAVVRCFRARSIVPAVNGQAVANAIYALGFCQVGWADFPEEVRAAFEQAIVLCGPHLKPQELANLVYGLGMLRANYAALGPETRLALENVFVRLTERMLEQEACSFLHGLAKMEARWEELSARLRDTVLGCIARQGTMNCVCLGCMVYSLGLLGAQWDSLPVEVSGHIVRTALERPLTDQTLSNTLYGLSLMGTEWDALQPQLRETLLMNLARPDAFLADNPQHVSNTLWSLGKMDATWLQLPGEALTTALVRCVHKLGKQELANAIYGLAIIDVPWAALSVEVVLALERALQLHLHSMTVQETANVMYSLALLSFDFHEKDEIIIPPEAMPSAGVAVSWTGKSVTNAPPTNNDARLESLWRIHEAVQRAYLRQAPAQFVRENYDQFAIYFELMRVLHRGQALVARVFGADNAPRPSGPAATVPSKMHAMTVQAMMTVLLQLSPRYACFNEFCGLQGVFPVDAAVYYDEKLVALVEVDGEFHYKLLGQQLRRKDWLKEFLYRCHYPTVPLYRMRLDQLQVIGYPRAGEALANWINRDVQIKIGNIA